MNLAEWEALELAGTERGAMNPETGLLEYSPADLAFLAEQHLRRIRDLDNIESKALGRGGIHYSANDDILFLLRRLRVSEPAS